MLNPWHGASTLEISMIGSCTPDQLRRVGLVEPSSSDIDQKLLLYTNLKLRDLGCPTFPLKTDSEIAELVGDMIARNRQLFPSQVGQLCPINERIQSFLNRYLRE